MEIVLNHAEYLEWKYNKKSLTEIKFEKSLDGYIKHIKRNKQMYKYLILGTATILFLVENKVNVKAADLGQIDNLGNTFLNIVRRVGYWLALIMAIVEIIKAAMRGGNSSGEIGKIILKYVFIYASMFIIPWLFDLVKSSF